MFYGEFGRSWASHDVGLKIINTADGGYLLGGSSKSDYQASADIWLVKTDAEGDILWSRVLNLNNITGDNVITALIEAHDGGFLMSLHHFLVKTSSTGEYKSTRIIGKNVTQPYTLKQQNNSIDFFYPASSKAEGYLRLYSVEGVLLKQSPIANGFGGINHRDLPQGMGIFSVKINGVNYSQPVMLEK